MKAFIYLFILLLFSPWQSALAESTKVVMHLNDTSKLPHLEKNIGNIRKGMGEDVDIQVVINGRAVSAMLSGNKLVEDKVKSMLSNNAKIGLCHTAMRNNNVNEHLLIDGVTILPEGGIVTLIKLQKDGYAYIKI